MNVIGMPQRSDWKELYRLALMETDPDILRRKIAGAHHAILDRIEATSRTSGGDAEPNEQQLLHDALNGLCILQQELENPDRKPGKTGKGPKIRFG